jgi:putative transposase
METKSTNHANFSLGYHIVWCSKYRHQVLKDAIEVELKQVLAEVCAHYEWSLVSIEIMPDHVHIFVQADPHIAPVQIAHTLKSISAVHLFNKFFKSETTKILGIRSLE